MLEVLNSATNEKEIQRKEISRTEVRVSELSKSFLSPAGDAIPVLNGISLTVSSGEALAVMGASGAGKSTLLNLLGGLETADSGQILLDEFSITHATAAKLARERNRRIGFVFQFHHLLPDLSAVENVAMPLMIAGSSQREALRRGREALEDIGLANKIDHPVTYLSGGEQQRIAVSRALINDPQLVLADEPTGNLDARIAHEISSLLVSFAHKRGGILIVATHNERLARMCDRVLMLKEGTLHPD